MRAFLETPVVEIVIVLVAVFVAQVTPGPNMMAVASASLGSGRRAGIFTAMGVSIGVFVWAVLFTTGGGAFIQAFPTAIPLMKLMGGAYLLFIAGNAIRRALFQSPNLSEVDLATSSGIGAFGRGFFVASTNPKAALVWVAVSAYLAPLALSMPQYLLFGLAVASSAAIVFGSYAYLFSMAVAVRGHRRFFRSVEVAFGTVFGAIGGTLILNGVQELRN